MNDNRRGGGGGFFGDDIFSSFHHQMTRDFTRMFQEMEEIMREFNHGDFVFIDKDEIRQAPGAAIQDQERQQSLRDRFLKSSSDDDDHDKSQRQSIREAPVVPPFNPGFGMREGNYSIFDRFFYPPAAGERFFNNQPKVEFRDEDLDEKIARDGFDKVAREDLLKNTKKTESSRPFSFHGQSYSISRVQRPDGSIEEVKTTRSSDGKEEKVVTRIVGDKKHSIVEKSNKDGTLETEEHFENFDTDELDDFNRMWSKISGGGGATRSSIGPPKAQISEPSNPTDRDSENNKSLTSKLFSWFKK